MKISGLGVWNLYFLIKFALFAYGEISFHFLENLAFFAFLTLSFSEAWQQRLKNVSAAIFASALLYYDSWLPPISRLTKQVGNVQDFSLDYFFEISARVVSIDLLLSIFIVCVLYRFSHKWLRYTSISLLGFAYAYWLSTAPVINSSQTAQLTEQRNQPITSTQPTVNVGAGKREQTPDEQLEDFYQQQSLLKSVFPDRPTGEPFDVLILNICSLATADLEAIGVDETQLFSNFDILFSDFNSATSYSGPAAIRLLRASCGQTSQTDLFKSVPEQCYLFNNLQELGYDTSVAMNHDGHFDDFKGLINKYGGMNTTELDFSGYSPAQYGFDGKPIYSDKDVLTNWLDAQSQNSGPRSLYYNTISLHDGNQIAGYDRMSSTKSYPIRQQQLFSDINQFIEKLEQQQRNTLLVIVPEHGAALEGDKVQFSGLREIPSPKIVSVPSAIKFIGPNVRHSGLIEVKDSTSYFGLSEIISRALRNDIFSGESSIQSLLDNLPRAPKVAENEDTIMMYIGNKPYIQLDGGEWTAYPQSN
ncbi:MULTISPECIES: cellulose biosynthesis protein BcsG [unclassified Pseudoalteromonas]|uniref:cellulose biosynthesis protein BcsG n=1 Tax=unclassified Pseudoalteromonas TaxID=194690 RepID=UPI0025B5F5A1|nr:MULTISPECIES: cellulose biosynthesis protein BcsG [unclassified Pseudoalteromonas]MDN3376975.1 cellulose biosynthesis protein BcsG [Pseudoalteromonas sp. APC 3893]MDN3388481.1 cellulose biosynthesis protein BcsG [Pseudoalteromonas sp. APC 4017]